MSAFIIKDPYDRPVTDDDDSEDRPLIFDTYEAAETHASELRKIERGYCVAEVEPGTLCPECGGADIAAETKTWINYEAGSPAGFDDEDLGSCEPLPGGEHICRSCQHTWRDAEDGSGSTLAIDGESKAITMPLNLVERVRADNEAMAAALDSLFAWADQMGGWDAPCWEQARDARKEVQS
jgi:hypothetical protein